MEVRAHGKLIILEDGKDSAVFARYQAASLVCLLFQFLNLNELKAVTKELSFELQNKLADAKEKGDLG